MTETNSSPLGTTPNFSDTPTELVPEFDTSDLQMTTVDSINPIEFGHGAIPEPISVQNIPNPSKPAEKPSIDAWFQPEDEFIQHENLSSELDDNSSVSQSGTSIEVSAASSISSSHEFTKPFPLSASGSGSNILSSATTWGSEQIETGSLSKSTTTMIPNSLSASPNTDKPFVQTSGLAPVQTPISSSPLSPSFSSFRTLKFGGLQSGTPWIPAEVSSPRHLEPTAEPSSNLHSPRVSSHRRHGSSSSSLDLSPHMSNPTSPVSPPGLQTFAEKFSAASNLPPNSQLSVLTESSNETSLRTSSPPGSEKDHILLMSSPPGSGKYGECGEDDDGDLNEKADTGTSPSSLSSPMAISSPRSQYSKMEAHSSPRSTMGSSISGSLPSGSLPSSSSSSSSKTLRTKSFMFSPMASQKVGGPSTLAERRTSHGAMMNHQIIQSLPQPVATALKLEALPAPEMKTGGMVHLLQWAWDKRKRNTFMKVSGDQSLLSWSSLTNWGLARSCAPIQHKQTFIELARARGVSQLLQVGLARSDVDWNMSPAKMQFTSVTISGDWSAAWVKSSASGDRLGVLYDLEAHKMVIYRNGLVVLTHDLPVSYNIVESPSSSEGQEGQKQPIAESDALYPFIGICGDQDLLITSQPEFEKYVDISWGHDRIPQHVVSKETVEGVPAILDSLGLEKLRPKFEGMTITAFQKLKENDLRKLGANTEQRRRIMSHVETMK